MSALYDDFPLGEGGFTDYGDFRDRLASAGGDDLAERLDGWVYGTLPLPVAEALESIGWALGREDISDAPVQVSLGLSLRGNPQKVRYARLDGAPGEPASMPVTNCSLSTAIASEVALTHCCVATPLVMRLSWRCFVMAPSRLS